MSRLASGSLSPPAWGLSPLRDEAPRSPPPATPGALYRSCFAAECEALVLQLGQEGGGDACGKALALPTPGRRALTVEAETLTPLEASWAFLAESPRGPSEQLPGPAPPSPGNRTYDKAASLCLASCPSAGLAAAQLQDAADDPRRTFERLPGEASLSFVASTPLPPRRGFFQQTPQEQEEVGFPEACPRPLKDAPVRKSLSLAVGGRVTAEAAAAPGVRGGHGKRSSNVSSASMARRESSGAAAAKGQKLPDERISLSKLPYNKKSRPPSRPSRGPGLLNGLAPPSVVRKSKSPGSKLPVRSAAGCDKASQKRPLERHLVKGATTVQKQSASKRFCPGKSCTENPARGVLLDTGQIPSAALQTRPASPCPQCQQLAEENRRLKSMLENCERRITALTQRSQMKSSA